MLFVLNCNIWAGMTQMPSSNSVEVLIDNMILAIKWNASMLSAQDIHKHVTKYVEIEYMIIGGPG